MLKYFKYSLVAGLASALVSIIYFTLSIAFGFNPLGGSKAFGYILMVLMFFPALWHFRKNYLNGEMHFHQAFFLTIQINLYSCLFFVLFVALYLNVLDPSLLVRHITESKMFFASIKDDFIKTNSLEAYTISLASIDKLTAFDIVKDEFMKRFFILLFFVMLVSFVMRRTPEWAASK